jgi:hypothetical protein
MSLLRASLRARTRSGCAAFFPPLLPALSSRRFFLRFLPAAFFSPRRRGSLPQKIDINMLEV